MMQPVCIPVKPTPKRVVRPKYPDNLPRMGWHCKNDIEKIWAIVGSSEFVYAYISDVIQQRPGILRRMANTGIIIPTGLARTSGATMKWKLSPSVIMWAEYKFGKVLPEVEENCQEFNDKLYRVSVETYRKKQVSRETQTKQVRYNEYFQRCKPIAYQIWAEFGDIPFTFIELQQIGYNVVTQHTAKQMHKCGFVEPVGMRNGVVVFQIVETAIRSTA